MVNIELSEMEKLKYSVTTSQGHIIFSRLSSGGF